MHLVSVELLACNWLEYVWSELEKGIRVFLNKAIHRVLSPNISKPNLTKRRRLICVEVVWVVVEILWLGLATRVWMERKFAFIPSTGDYVSFWTLTIHVQCIHSSIHWLDFDSIVVRICIEGKGYCTTKTAPLTLGFTLVCFIHTNLAWSCLLLFANELYLHTYLYKFHSDCDCCAGW